MGEEVLRPRSNGETGAAPRAAASRYCAPLALAVALLAAIVSVASAEDAVSLPDSGVPMVRAIEVRSDAPLKSAAELRSLLAFGVGDELTASAVRRSLRNVQASGLAARVAVYQRSTAAGDGVVATVVLWANVVVDEVRVEGELGTFRKGELERALPQREGEPLVESRLLRGVYRLQDLLADRGHFKRRVIVAPEIDEARRRAVIVYRVTAGPRATVAEVRFDGPIAPFTADELIARLRLHPGEPFRRGAVSGDAERLRSWLIEQKYRAARVDEAVVEFRAETDTVALTFPIDVGPLVSVIVTGAEMDKLRKRGLLPFLGADGYDEALVLQAVDRVEAHFQKQGHYDARVAYREVRGDGTLELHLEVEPGPIYTLEEIRLSGNQSFSADKLTALMETSAKSLLTLGSGRLVDETLTADLTNVRSFYALEGFRQVKVGPEEVGRRGHDLVLTIPVDEGPRQQVATLDFAGITVFDRNKLRRKLALAAGGPFHPRLLDDSLNAIQADYERDGYDQAQVSAKTDWNDDRTLVDVTVQVFEGPQTVVDRVIVRGNRATQAGVIRRAVGLASGQPVSTSRLLEVERRLYRLGIFSRVDVELTPAPLGATTRDVLVEVEEGRVQRIAYGFGYDTEDGIGGLATYTHRNLFGRALSFTADGRVREKRQQFRLFLDQPYFPGLRVPVTYSIFRLEEDRESFELTKWGTRVDVIKSFGTGSRLAIGYDYRIVDNRIKPDVSPDSGDDDVAREDQTLRISSVIPNFQLDRRDDPLNATRGWNSVVQLQYSFPFLNAEADFLKLFLQQTHLVNLGRAGVVAGSARLGAIEPLAPLAFEDPLVPPALPNADIFIAERFFAGGSSTHRAFDRDRLGIPDRTLFPDARGKLVPAGGNGLFLLNLDYRFPIVDPVGGTVFFDTGNVWADWRDLDPADLRSGVGVGLRYLSPIGPVRVEVGWPLDRLPGDDRYVVFLSLGNPF